MLRTRARSNTVQCFLVGLMAAVPLLAPGGAAGQAIDTAGPVDGSGEGFPAVSATRVASPPLIDGVLDDPAWAEAPVLADFIQRVPRDGMPPTEPTEVRVLYDDDAIYVGVWLWDSDPDQIVEGESIRNAPLDDSDAVLLIFDTYGDRQNGFVFGTNPSGIEYDGQVSDEGRGGGGMGGMGGRQQAGAGGGFNLNWDGSWDVATSRDGEGWYAEFRIPFSTLRYGAEEVQTWGFNVMRRLRRANEESYWSQIPRQYSLFRLSRAGFLEGVEPPTVRTTTITPYVLGSAERNYQAGDESFRYPGDVGADAKVQVTRGLTLDLTYNTDFAQVEADEVQMDLTRFRLFFPELRPFFLENAGFFNVGTGGTELFFSRRIGMEEGAVVPIRGGGRLSGRAAGLNVGLLHIRTGREGELLPGAPSGEAFSVARVAREFSNRTRVGSFFGERKGLGIDGQPNRTYAVDGQVGFGDGLTVNSFLARTDTPGLEGRDHAAHLSGTYLTRELRASLTYREVGEDFNPEVGFVNRRNYRTYNTFVMTYLRPERFPVLRELRPHVSYNTFRNLETGFEQSARVHVDSHVEFENGAFFSPAFNWVREGLEVPFQIHPEVAVAPGTYDGWEAAWRFNTNESAALSLNGGLDVGSFLSGNRRGFQVAATARSGSTATASLQVGYNDVRLEEGDFTATVIAGRVGYFFTPRIALQSLVQYSDQLDLWSANVRLGWLGTAGTGLFVVFNDARGVGNLDGPLNRSFVVKYSRQFTLGAW